jgi:predicted DsbA family dithiol-disulfide isomerase
MHDLLFRHQGRLGDADLCRYADSLGIDCSLVVGDAAQPFGDEVEADFASWVAAGVRGTPWLFVNAVPYVGRISLAGLRRVVAGSAGAGGLVPGAKRPPPRPASPARSPLPAASRGSAGRGVRQAEDRHDQ